MNMDSEIERAFVNFLARHGRAYRSKEEHARRLEIFRGTYEMVQRHNARAEATSVLEINRFADMEDEEFRS